MTIFKFIILVIQGYFLYAKLDGSVDLSWIFILMPLMVYVALEMSDLAHKIDSGKHKKDK